MRRLFLPLLFAAAAATVYWFNRNSPDAKLVFPLFSLVTTAQYEQGELTWKMFAALSGLTAAWGAYGWLSSPRDLQPPSA